MTGLFICKTEVQAIIMSKLDYCNSLLADVPEYKLDRLQHLQNMACSVVCNLHKYDHVSTSMKSFHWLKFCERITYKFSSLVYRYRNNQAPDYWLIYYKNKDITGMSDHQYQTTTPLTTTKTNLQLSLCSLQLVHGHGTPSQSG